MDRLLNLLVFALLVAASYGSRIGNTAVTANLTKELAFKVDFSRPTLSQAFGGSPVSYGNHNAILWASGTGMEVWYPRGSYVPSGPIVGGVGIWSRHPLSTPTAVFKYSVWFGPDFDFVNGGKLPGLYGGKTGCSGGDPAVDCFSTRLMWRANGMGEMYLYANREAQDPAICQMPNNHCDPTFGWSLNRNSFLFVRNAWTHVEETITLNTPGQRNGLLAVKINGQEILRYNNIVFRTAQYPQVRIEGMDFETFFGGNGPQWASPRDQMTKFTEVILESYQ